MGSNRDLLIVGAGKVGTNLARLAAARHQTVTLYDVVPLTPEAERALSTTKPVQVAVADVPAGPFGLVLLAVPDGDVEAVAEAVAGWPCAAGVPLAHTSGSRGCLELPSGRTVGVCHPAFAFPSPDLPLYRLQKVAFLVDGTDTEREAFADLVSHWGATAVASAGTDRLLYHAGCVTASNFLALLGVQAGALFGQSGVPESGRDALLLSLMESVLEHARSHGFAAAMTGPAARGDAETLIAEATRIGQEDPDSFSLFIEANVALLAHHGHDEALEQLLAWLEELNEE